MRSSNSNINNNSRFKVRNGSIQRKQGWGFFLLGLFIATVFGFSVRSYLGPKSIAYWIQEELKKNDLDGKVVVRNPRLSLQRNSFPRIGLNIEFVSLPVGPVCGEHRANSDLKLESVYIPLQVGSLLQGRIKLADAVIKRLEWTVFNDCNSSSLVDGSERADDLNKKPPEALVAGEVPRKNRPLDKNDVRTLKKSLGDLSKAKDIVQSQFFLGAKDYFKNRWRNDWKNTNELISGLHIEQLDLFIGQQQRWAQLLNFRVAIEDNGLINIHTKAHIESFVFGGYEVRPFDIRLDVNSSTAQIKLEGLLREGLVKFDWLVDWSKDQQSWDLMMKDLPLETVAATVSQWNPKELPSLNFNQTWASCNARQKSSLLNYSSEPIYVTNCLAYGKGGKVEISDLSFQIHGMALVEPFKVGLNGFSIEHLGSAVGRKGFGGAFNKLGRIFGNLEFKAFDDVSGLLHFKDMEVAFSNRGSHGRQVVKNVMTEISYQNQRFSGLVRRIELDKGFFAGTLSFNFDHLFKSGAIQLKINQLQFSPSIQKLMVDGEMDPLEIYGQALVTDGMFSNWRGVLGVPKARGKYWQVQRIKIDSTWESAVFKGKLVIEKFQLEPEERFSQVIHPIFLELDQKPKLTQWRSLVANLEIDSLGGQWSGLKVKLNREGGFLRGRLKSEGTWLKNEKIKARVELSRPNWPNMAWGLDGDWSEMYIYPSLEMVKKLALQSRTQKVKLNDKVLKNLKLRREEFVQENLTSKKSTQSM